jgi:hypothetical protein
MKGLATVVLALCLVGSSARIVVLEAAAAEHTDAWCADHFLGNQAQECVKNPGCCYAGDIGVCHSCTAHSDEWCAEYGGTDLNACIAYSGCTFAFESHDADSSGICESNSDPDSIIDEQTCEEALVQASDDVAAGVLDEDGNPVTWIPQCDADTGTWLAQQEDEAAGFTWCVDENGHEIPDSHFQSALFASKYVNCEKERKQYAGLQCPNAVVLTTGNGETFLNDNEDVGNCDVTCNTDLDCRGIQWCCYNGCGYSCQEPIKPKASCDQILLEPSLSASDLSLRDHGSVVTVSCNEGYFGSDPVDISCKHGKWDSYDMECLKDCEEYHVPYSGLDRTRNYNIKGKGLHHGHKRTLSCPHGYGAIAGGEMEMWKWEETVRCVNGAWEQKTLECSTCFDAPHNDVKIPDCHCPLVPPAMIEPLFCDECDMPGPNSFTVPSKDNAANLFDCVYFQSRPAECAKYPAAMENCRIACYSCEEMNREYKVKALKDEIPLRALHKREEHPEEPIKWLKKHVRVKKGFQNVVTDMRRKSVARLVRKGD